MGLLPGRSGVGVRPEIPRHADVERRETELHQPGDATAEHCRDSDLRAAGGTAVPREARRDRKQRNGREDQTDCRGGDHPPIERTESAPRTAYVRGADRARIVRRRLDRVVDRRRTLAPEVLGAGWALVAR